MPRIHSFQWFIFKKKEKKKKNTNDFGAIEVTFDLCDARARGARGPEGDGECDEAVEVIDPEEYPEQSPHVRPPHDPVRGRVGFVLKRPVREIFNAKCNHPNEKTGQNHKDPAQRRDNEQPAGAEPGLVLKVNLGFVVSVVGTFVGPQLLKGGHGQLARLTMRQRSLILLINY